MGEGTADGMTRGRKRFPGGYRFTRFEGQPDASVLELAAPETVIIPLQQGFRDPMDAVVGVGDTVSAGQVVGRNDDGLSSPVHSSVSGVVEAVRAGDPEDGTTGCIVIRAGTAGECEKLQGHAPDWDSIPAETIEELLYSSGVSALGRDGIPTRHRSAVIAPADVEAVIIHDTGSDLYNPSLRLLLGGERVQQFVAGVGILKKVMPGARVHVAIDARETALVGELSSALSSLDSVEVHALAPKYPQDFAEVLVPMLTGRPFPHGYTAANIGVVTLDCQAVLHAYEAVVEGKPLIERVVALCGPGFRQPCHAKVRLGTPVADVIRQTTDGSEGLRIIRNSALTGEKLTGPACAVDRSYSAVIALPEQGAPTFMPFVRPGFTEDAYSRTFLACLLPTTKKVDAGLKGEPRPCVSCGYCQDVCPVGIIPHLLYKYASRGFLEDRLVDELRIFDCIGCNLCSYVCPSKIGIASHIRTGQEKLRDDGVDNARNVLPFCDLKGLESDPGGEA